MRRRTRNLLALPLAAVALTAACGGDSDDTASDDTASGETSEGTPTGGETVDNCGVEVDLSTRPERVFLMFHAAIEMAFALDAGDQVVGSAFLDNAIRPDLADAFEGTPYQESYPSKEELLRADPDFVYASFSSAFNDERFGTREDLADLGIGTWVFQESCPSDQMAGNASADVSFDTTLEEIRRAGLVFGREDEAAELIAQVEDQIAEVEATVGDVAERPRVLAFEPYKGEMTARGNKGIMQDIIDGAGGENVFADQSDSPVISIEQIIEQAPDAIIIYTCCGSDRVRADTEPEVRALLDDPALANVPAIRDERILVVDFADTSVSIRNGDTLVEVAEFLHPDLFD